MIAYIVDIVRATRSIPGVVLGASPRASVHLLSAAKAHARLANRSIVSREDVAEMAEFALAHRLIVSGVQAEAVVRQAVELASKVQSAD